MRTAVTPFTTIALNPSSAMPLYRQLYEGLRSVILSGQLRAGARLPSTRALASELGIARSTVLIAFEQLLAEGYVEGKPRAGTYVARALPDAQRRVLPHVNPTDGERARQPLSRRGTALVTRLEQDPAQQLGSEGIRHGQSRPVAFVAGLPALDAFPYGIWERLVRKHWRCGARDLLRHWWGVGYQPLREAIAAYLGGTRAVRCTAEQVIVVSHTKQALDLTARVLLEPGDAAWVEDPNLLGAANISSFSGTGYTLPDVGVHLIPVSVDQSGLDVRAGIARCPDARLALVTPSRQFPLGVTMSVARRLELLHWAHQAGAWVLEDDYDSTFRYVGQPLSALQGLDTEGRVIYCAQFRTILPPGLSIGYLVVPPDLVDAFVAVHFARGIPAPSMLDQAVLADFMVEGHFVRHLRRMRALYAARQAGLVDTARRELSGLLDIEPADAGMHLVGWLPEGVDDRAVARRAAAHGVSVLPLSSYSMEPIRRGALILGYTAVDAREMPAAVARLAAALRETVLLQPTRSVGKGVLHHVQPATVTSGTASTSPMSVSTIGLSTGRMVMVATRQVTIVCARCHRQATVEHALGRRPRYCSVECAQMSTKERTRARVARLRERRQQARESVTHNT